MFVLGNFILAFAGVVSMILTAVYWLVLIRALISWINPDPFNPIVRFLYQTTEPLLAPVRRMMPPMGIDFSPIIVFVGVMFLRMFLVQSLVDLGTRLRMG